MLWLHFLVGDRLFFDGQLEDKEKMEEAIRNHLCIEDRDRYLIYRERDEEDPTIIRVWVDDRVTWDRFTQVDQFIRMVNAEQPRRTVWINPPSEEEKLGNERSCPWNTHYTEYIQIYHIGCEEKRMYTIKYWKRFEDIHLYDPTPLAQARYAYLASLYTSESPHME